MIPPQKMRRVVSFPWVIYFWLLVKSFLHHTITSIDRRVNIAKYKSFVSDNISLVRVYETFLNLSTFDANTDEKDKRSLAASFDCRQKPLCDPSAICKADLRDEKRYICVCNNGFEGNGSICQGLRAFVTHCSLQRIRLSSFCSSYYFHPSLVQLAK